MELIKTAYKGPVFLNGMSRHYKTVRPKECAGGIVDEDGVNLGPTEDMVVRLNYIWVNVGMIYKQGLLEW